MHLGKRIGFLLLSVAAFMASTAHAAPILNPPSVYLRDAADGVDKNNNPAPWDVFRANSVVNNAATEQGYPTPAGTFSLEMSFDGPNGPYLPLLTYCADASMPLNPAAYGTAGKAYSMVTPTAFGLNSTVVNALQLLYANAFNESLGSATKAAAFQVMVWEYISDVNASNPFNLSSGNIQTSNTAIQSQILTWTNQLNTWTAKSTNLMILDGRASGLQSVFYNNVPEPSTYALIGCGLLCGLVARRRNA